MVEKNQSQSARRTQNRHQFFGIAQHHEFSYLIIKVNILGSIVLFTSEIGINKRFFVDVDMLYNRAVS